MYKLFIGFRKLGEFPTIQKAKQYAQRMKQAGVFTLLGDDYRDSWYIPEIENKLYGRVDFPPATFSMTIRMTGRKR